MATVVIGVNKLFLELNRMLWIFVNFSQWDYDTEDWQGKVYFITAHFDAGGL